MLELEVKLALNRTGSEYVIRAPKVRIRDVVVDTREVQYVEQVEHVGANFEPSALTQQLYWRQPEGLRDCQIQTGILRPRERVANGSRGAGKLRRRGNMTGIAPVPRVVNHHRFGEVQRSAWILWSGFWPVAGSGLE